MFDYDKAMADEESHVFTNINNAKDESRENDDE